MLSVPGMIHRFVPCLRLLIPRSGPHYRNRKRGSPFHNDPREDGSMFRVLARSSRQVQLRGSFGTFQVYASAGAE